LIDGSGERFWRSMRKSLGSKRREITDEARAEIVRIYGEYLNGHAGYGDVSKIFPTTDFGYREIRVERPLRLRFEVTDDALIALAQEKAMEKLAATERQELLAVLQADIGDEVFMDRVDFDKALTRALRDARLKIGAPVRKAILSQFSTQDEAAAICRDKDGKPEPDTSLRDHELVPLLEDWQSYFDREVQPFVPDAWVDTAYTDGRDGKVGRVGYEINFNRYFYRYVPPRPLAEIDAELKSLESEIATLLSEVVV
jgi:type I restriction enzyme M protein